MKRFSLITLLALLTLASCKKDDELKAPYGGYPQEIAEIMIKQCATSGCHNDQSAVTAAGLNLTTWENMFAGSKAGAAVVPFRADQSFLTYFINTDSSQGIVLEPTMPLNGDPLTHDQIMAIHDWINQGAPGYEGDIKWTSSSRAWYIANQGCDLVAKMDPATGLVMRYFNIGMIDGYTESPHMMRVSPDGNYWYVVFLSNNPFIECYSTATDSLVGKVNIGFGDWNTISLSPDGKYAYCVAFNSQKIAIANLETFTLEGTVNVTALPHGSTVQPDFKAVYVTQQVGNNLYKLEITSPPMPSALDEIPLEQYVPSPNGANFNAHEVAFTPDGSKYLVSCQGTNEVRIYNAANDSLLAAIGVGNDPSEFAFSSSKGLAFVSCMEDVTNFTGPGSVAIIDYNNLSLVKHVFTGIQPHAMIVDEVQGWVAVANRNQNQNGPAPHHTSACGGRNGYLTLIDLTTLDLVPGWKRELSVDPYSITLKP